MAQWIKTDGTTIEVEPKNGTDFSLDELQGFVGGYIEVLLCGDRYLVCDEEGKLKNKPLNMAATMIADEYYKNDCIVGDALICNLNQII
mgnify:CR=1 FL=1